jgi:glycosyltransferase involved in cell wall biosynthesis
MSADLVIDARWMKTGIGRYILALIKGLRQNAPALDIRCITNPQYVGRLSEFCDQIVLSKSGIYTIQEQIVLPWIARKSKAFYSPHYNVPLLWKNRLLVTIHDLNHLLDTTYGSTLKSRYYAKPLLQRAIDKADIIVTPSDYTKRMLQQHLDADPRRITVIPCPVSEDFSVLDKSESREVIRKHRGINGPFALFVGNVAPNKNIPTLLQAFAQLRRLRRDIPVLVMVARGAKRRLIIEKQVHELGLKDIVEWIEGIDNSLLARLYAAAEMTIVPSLQEGFGLPVIEAMACGTPVICSNAASLPEVAGEAALLFDPHSTDELVEVMMRLLDSVELQRALISSGIKRANRFSQESFALRQSHVVQRLLLS